MANDLVTDTYLDGLEAAKAACHELHDQSMQDLREAISENDHRSAAYAIAEALGVWLCIERIEVLIKQAKREPPIASMVPTGEK